MEIPLMCACGNRDSATLDTTCSADCGRPMEIEDLSDKMVAIQMAVSALRNLRTGDPNGAPCWCPKGFRFKHTADRHTPDCERARIAVIRGMAC